ncbi:MAG TPA: DUF3616 domain-containing protein, partial [Blastocatellia bacterium]|nr:DUF3616 domain-containing protein [Blastocatellia bacterium]
GITQFGSHFMIAGSLATEKSNHQGALAAFDFDPATQAVSNAVVITGLRKFLFDNVPELRKWADKTSAEGGLNIEGIAADPDPQHPRLLLGLRGPLAGGLALVVPIKFRNPQAPLSIDNLAIDEPSAIHLNLHGQGIRDIEYDSRLRSFLIISGAPENEKKTHFALWLWSGENNQHLEQAKPHKQAKLDSKMVPEGVTRLKIADHDFVFLVGDRSSYAKIEYVSQ